MDRAYNDGFRQHFDAMRAAGDPPVAWLDGRAPESRVLDQALSALDAMGVRAT